MIFCQTGGNAIVKNHPIFFKHYTVTTFSNGKLEVRISINTGDKFSGVRALYIDFTQRRRVQYANTIAHSKALSIDCRVHVFTLLWEIPRAFPLANIFPCCAMFLMPAMHGGVAFGVEKGAYVPTGNGTKSGRCISGSKHSGAGFANRLPQRIGENSYAIDIAQLTLVGAEPHGSIAFCVLNRLISFTSGEFDGRRRYIKLQINKLTGRTAG